MRSSSRPATLAVIALALALALVSIVSACGGGRQRPRPSATANSLRGLGCPSDTECPDGMRCLSFTAADGTTDNACEDPCEEDGDCPAGLACAAIADRPGKVCR